MDFSLTPKSSKRPKTTHTTNQTMPIAEPLMSIQAFLLSGEQFKKAQNPTTQHEVLKTFPESSIMLNEEQTTINKTNDLTIVTTVNNQTAMRTLINQGGIQIATLHSSANSTRVVLFRGVLFCFILKAHEIASARLIIDAVDQNIKDDAYYVQPRCVLYPTWNAERTAMIFKDVGQVSEKTLTDFPNNLMVFVSSSVLDFKTEPQEEADFLEKDEEDEEEESEQISRLKSQASSKKGFKRAKNNFFRDILQTMIIHTVRFYAYADYDVVCRVDIEKIHEGIKLLAEESKSWFIENLITEDQKRKISLLALNHYNFCTNHQGSCFRLFNLDRKIIPTELLQNDISFLQQKVQTMLKMKQREAIDTVYRKYGAFRPIVDIEWCPELEAIFEDDKAASTECSRLRPYKSLFTHVVHEFLKSQETSKRQIQEQRKEATKMFASRFDALKTTNFQIQNSETDCSDRALLFQHSSEQVGKLRSMLQNVDTFYAEFENLFTTEFTDWKNSKNSRIPEKVRTSMSSLLTQYFFKVHSIELVISFRAYPLTPAHSSSQCKFSESDKKFNVDFSDLVSTDNDKHKEYENKVKNKFQKEQPLKKIELKKAEHVAYSAAARCIGVNTNHSDGKKKSKKGATKPTDNINWFFYGRPQTPRQLVPHVKDHLQLTALDDTKQNDCFWFVKSSSQTIITIPIQEHHGIKESGTFGFNLSLMAKGLLRLERNEAQNCVPLEEEAVRIIEDNNSKINTRIVLPTHITYIQTYVTYMNPDTNSDPGFFENLNNHFTNTPSFIRFPDFLKLFVNCTIRAKKRTFDATSTLIPFYYLDTQTTTVLHHQHGCFGLALKQDTSDKKCVSETPVDRVVNLKKEKEEFIILLQGQQCVGAVKTLFDDYMRNLTFDSVQLTDIKSTLKSITDESKYNFIKRDKTHLGVPILLMALCTETVTQEEDEQPETILSFKPNTVFKNLFLQNDEKLLQEPNFFSLYVVFVFSFVFTFFHFRDNFNHIDHFMINTQCIKSVSEEMLTNTVINHIVLQAPVFCPEYSKSITFDFLKQNLRLLKPTKDEIQDLFPNVYDWLYHQKYGSLPSVKETVDFKKIRGLAQEILLDENGAGGAGA